MSTLEKIKAELKRRYWKTNQGKPSKRDGYNNAIDDALQIIDKYAEQEPTKQREKELAEEWKCGYEMGFEEAKVFYEKEEPFGPCDLCRFNPPSSADGKPCTMCPAERRER